MGNITGFLLFIIYSKGLYCIIWQILIMPCQNLCNIVASVLKAGHGTTLRRFWDNLPSNGCYSKRFCDPNGTHKKVIFCLSGNNFNWKLGRTTKPRNCSIKIVILPLYVIRGALHLTYGENTTRHGQTAAIRAQFMCSPSRRLYEDSRY